FLPVFDVWGNYDPKAPNTKVSFSRLDLFYSLLSAQSEMMARRTSVPNNLYIWPVADPKGYNGQGGQKYLPVVTYLRMSNTGGAGLKKVMNNITIAFNTPVMPAYTGYNWNTDVNENCDNCGRSYANSLNHRSLLYWEIYDCQCNNNCAYNDTQWFHAS